MRISKKFAARFSRAAQKSMGKAYSFTVIIAQHHFEIVNGFFLIISADGEVIYDAKQHCGDCIQWFFNHFNLENLRDAQIKTAA